MTNRGFIQILGPVLVVIALVGGGYIYYQLHYAKPVTQAPVIDSGSSNENTFGTNYGAKPTPPQINPTQPVACTAEAKLCPDGSAVGRTGPNCEFAACPNNSPVLTQELALSLVKKQWGDCTPDSCSKVEAIVSNQNNVWYVTATYLGLRDDSVANDRKMASATFSNNEWILGDPIKSWNCQFGRGHQDFSTEPCS